MWANWYHVHKLGDVKYYIGGIVDNTVVTIYGVGQY